jgi:hypothetical protein
MAANYPRWDQATGPVKCCKCRQPIAPGQDIWLKSKGIYYCAGCGLDREAAENAGEEVTQGGIEEALIKDFEAFPGEAADTTLARQSLYMARQLDYGEVAPREVTQYTKEIRLNLLQIRDLYPPDEDGDDTDDRRERLQERRRRENGSGI